MGGSEIQRWLFPLSLLLRGLLLGVLCCIWSLWPHSRGQLPGSLGHLGNHLCPHLFGRIPLGVPPRKKKSVQMVSQLLRWEEVAICFWPKYIVVVTSTHSHQHLKKIQNSFHSHKDKKMSFFMILRNHFYNKFVKIQRHQPSVSQVSLENYSSCLTGAH